MEATIIKTNKKVSLSLLSFYAFFVILMVYNFVMFFSVKDYNFGGRGDEIFWLGCICFPFFIINVVELIKSPIIILINENGIQFRQGFRFFYTPWDNISYIGDNSSARRQVSSIFSTAQIIDGQISMGFLQRKDVVEEKTFFSRFFKGINGEINIDINKTKYEAKEILNILAEYAKKYNPNISILENTNIVDEFY